MAIDPTMMMGGGGASPPGPAVPQQQMGPPAGPPMMPMPVAKKTRGHSKKKGVKHMAGRRGRHGKRK